MGYLYTGLVIFMGVMLKNVVATRYNRFKEREALKPQQMVLKNGVYVPWGRVQKIERGLDIGTLIWVIWIVGMLAAIFYVKVILGADHL